MSTNLGQSKGLPANSELIRPWVEWGQNVCSTTMKTRAMTKAGVAIATRPIRSAGNPRRYSLDGRQDAEGHRDGPLEQDGEEADDHGGRQLVLEDFPDLHAVLETLPPVALDERDNPVAILDQGERSMW